jgi:cobalt/nickel transport system permease protein
MDKSRQPLRKGFLERTVAALAAALDHAAFAEVSAESGGLLQRLDPRVKVFGFALLIVAAVSVHRTGVTLAIFVLAVLLALLSHIPLSLLATRAWLSVLCFTGAVALPAIFLTPGKMLVRVPFLNWPVTSQGLHTALRLVARAETAATLALLLVLCTPWIHVLKSLRTFRLPVILTVILCMTHRYIFLLMQIAGDFFEARRSRFVAPLKGPEQRRQASATAGVLLGKSLQLSGEAFMAMQSRGFRGEVYTLDEFRMKPRDWLAAGAFAAVAASAFWQGGF